MAKVGYARVSSIDQDYDLQIQALKTEGCKKIFAEKQSGTAIKGRAELELCLDYLREGDTLIVTRIDRLARSLRDLQNVVHDLEEQNIELKILDQKIDTSTSTGKAFLGFLGIFAEFENNLRRERQMEGIAKAKAKGKYKGRKPTAREKSDQVIALVKQGYTKQKIADKLGIGVASVYRILKNVMIEGAVEG